MMTPIEVSKIVNVEYTSVEVEYLEWAGKTIEELKKQVTALVEALKEIAKTEGPYSRDPKIHAENVIRNMAGIADQALALVEGDEDG